MSANVAKGGAIRGIGLAAFILLAGSAQAAITESVTVTNRYGYFFDSGAPDLGPGGTREQIFLNNGTPRIDASLGIDYVGEATPDSFFFLHNNYCVGLCTTGSETVISFTLTNTGNEAVALRFDSLITPGHLARIGDDSGVSAGFFFQVTQSGEGSPDTLYSAQGYIDGEQLGVYTSDDNPFNDERFFDNGRGGQVLDWSATNLNLELGRLLPGETTVVEYSASYYVNSFGTCTPGSGGCDGTQVVFGDPRKTGGGLNARTPFAASLDEELPPRDIINRDYGAYEVPFAFVESGSPLPSQPPAEPEFTYDGDFTVPAVPEPASWLSMIAGFGLLGGTMRRRRAGLAARSRALA